MEVGGWMDAGVDGMEGWMNGWVDVWMDDGWMNG